MTKRALVVGINDYSVQNAPSLSYCVNDANSMFHLLIEGFGFEQDNIILLRDERATRNNILSALAYLMANSTAGDVICFFFAGHGGIIPATTRSTNTRFYEAIIPYRGDWIFDFRLDEIANSTNFNPQEVNFTVILDSCHSGGMHASDNAEQSIPRSVPFDPLVAADLQNADTWWPFGICLPDGSSELIPNVSNPRVENNRLVDLDEHPDKTLLASAKSTLIAACKYYELAGEKDAYQHGLLTQGLLDLVNSSNFEISHHNLIEQLVSQVRTLSNNEQTPQLRGQAGRANDTFLQGWRSSQ